MTNYLSEILTVLPKDVVNFSIIPFLNYLDYIDHPDICDKKAKKAWLKAQTKIEYDVDNPDGVTVMRYKVNGKHHREDGPAVEVSNGDRKWYWKGKYHRLNGPALEFANGDRVWYKHGKYHRLDGPAIERLDRPYDHPYDGPEHPYNVIGGRFKIQGKKVWIVNGLEHREDDLPAIEYNDGAKEWIINGLHHRDNDKPAIIYPDGSMRWYRDGKMYKEVRKKLEFKEGRLILEMTGIQAGEFWIFDREESTVFIIPS